MQPARRKLRFASLDDVVAEVRRLMDGHVTVGQWTLGQIVQHLAASIRMSMEQTPTKFAWPIRRFIGPVLRNGTFAVGRFPRGIEIGQSYRPGSDADAAIEIERLREQIERFNNHNGPLDEHPLFGRLSHRQWERFHRLHCAHHLSFAVPHEAERSKR